MLNPLLQTRHSRLVSIPVTSFAILKPQQCIHLFSAFRLIYVACFLRIASLFFSLGSKRLRDRIYLSLTRRWPQPFSNWAALRLFTLQIAKLLGSQCLGIPYVRKYCASWIEILTRLSFNKKFWYPLGPKSSLCIQFWMLTIEILYVIAHPVKSSI